MESKKGLGEWWLGHGYNEGGQELIVCMQGGLSVIGYRHQSLKAIQERVISFE